MLPQAAQPTRPAELRAKLPMLTARQSQLPRRRLAARRARQRAHVLLAALSPPASAAVQAMQQQVSAWDPGPPRPSICRRSSRLRQEQQAVQSLAPQWRRLLRTLLHPVHPRQQTPQTKVCQSFRSPTVVCMQTLAFLSENGRMSWRLSAFWLMPSAPDLAV